MRETITAGEWAELSSGLQGRWRELLGIDAGEDLPGMLAMLQLLDENCMSVAVGWREIGTGTGYGQERVGSTVEWVGREDGRSYRVIGSEVVTGLWNAVKLMLSNEQR